jgi:hypothetical protein
MDVEFSSEELSNLGKFMRDLLTSALLQICLQVRNIGSGLDQ